MGPGNMQVGQRQVLVQLGQGCDHALPTSTFDHQIFITMNIMMAMALVMVMMILAMTMTMMITMMMSMMTMIMTMAIIEMKMAIWTMVFF